MTSIQHQPIHAAAQGLGPFSSNWRRAAAPAAAPDSLRGLDAATDTLAARFVPLVKRRARYMNRADRVLAYEAAMASTSDRRLRRACDELRELFRRRRDTVGDAIVAAAALRELFRRRCELFAHPVQIAAALAMWDGCVVELATGEGKTLSAIFPAALHGWRGRGCHVITVNDYLAARDARFAAGLLADCGLRVGCIQEETKAQERLAAYHNDVTYLTNKSATADFLRDRLQTPGGATEQSNAIRQVFGARAPGGQPIMRGLEAAIIDEADSVLIDEAVTPLIISGDAPNEAEAQAHAHADTIAAKLELGEHFRVDFQHREIRLTHAGRDAIQELADDLGGVWKSPRRSEELVTIALQAHRLFERGVHYVIDEGKVVIVDEFTGRMMPDRTWRDGVHQAVEAKEGLEISPAKATLARVSFQRFFRMYRRLCAMTGTAREAAPELWRTYRVPVVRIPTHKPCIRRAHRDRVFDTAQARSRAVADETSRAVAAGRAVLIGARSVEASESLSRELTALGLEHAVLNAVRHREEAEVVADAGRPGRVTIATNMAGRGTDIRLGPGVADAGGLCVIMTERHESRRIDRQLAGRSARQGDPGSAVALVSLDDELIRRHAPPPIAAFARAARRSGLDPAGMLSRTLMRLAQIRAQQRAQLARRQVLKQDEHLDRTMGFVGVGSRY